MIKLLIFLFLFISGLTFSQYNAQWVQRYNGPANSVDGGSIILTDSLNNVYVIGASAGLGYDYCLVKYDQNGNQLMLLRYDSPPSTSDIPTDAFIDRQLNIYITGRSDSAGSDYDFLTLKYNSLGNLLWQARYTSAGAQYDEPLKVIADDSGNVFIGGNINSYRKTVLLKYNSSGVLLWSKIHTSNIDGHHAMDFAADKNYNFYYTGYINDQNTITDFYTLKFTRTGNLIWNKTYNGSASIFDESYFIGIDGNFNVIVTGASEENNGSFINTIKYDSSGNELWQKKVNNNGVTVYPYAMKLDQNGNIYYTGSSSAGVNNYNFFTAKILTNGTLGWTSIFNGSSSGNDVPYSLTIDTSGRVLVCGSSLGNSSGLDYCTVVYNNLGFQLQELRYNGPAGTDDIAIKVIHNKETNSIFVTGSSTGTGSNRDFCTLKLSPVVGVQIVEGNFPNTFSLSQNYPNPFNPTTNFEFRIADFGFVNLTIYDAMGRVVKTLQHGDMKPGVYQAQWNAAEYPSGVYFYRLSANGFSQTRKLILIK